MRASLSFVLIFLFGESQVRLLLLDVDLIVSDQFFKGFQVILNALLVHLGHFDHTIVLKVEGPNLVLLCLASLLDQLELLALELSERRADLLVRQQACFALLLGGSSFLLPEGLVLLFLDNLGSQLDYLLPLILFLRHFFTCDLAKARL